jgi:hypothetical protein
MKNHFRSTLLGGLFLALSVILGCGSVEVQRPPEGFEPTCIQGTVFYHIPINGNRTPYSYARISAWRHGTQQGLAETIADGKGNYCLEVPLGEPMVDLRVFGVIRVKGTSYTCKGSENNVNPGATRKECGGDCIRIDIVTDCQEFEPPRHREM